jgi:hypothetical protein
MFLLFPGETKKDQNANKSETCRNTAYSHVKKPQAPRHEEIELTQAFRHLASVLKFLVYLFLALLQQECIHPK